MKHRGYAGKLRSLSLVTLFFLVVATVVYGALIRPDQAYGAASAAPPAAGLYAAETDTQMSEAVAEQVAADPAGMFPAEPEIPIPTTVRVASGDTVSSILEREGVPGTEIRSSIEALQVVFNPRHLKSGQEIVIAYDTQKTFSGFTVRLDVDEEIEVTRNDAGRFEARAVSRELATRLVRVDGRIESTLYGSALKAGLPIQVLYDMIYAYSFDIDFQRDIRQGDRYSVVYEQFLDDRQNVVRNGEIQYAELEVLGIERKLYRYSDILGESDFYDETGKTVRKQLLKTPVDVPRLTSGYGMRKHPIYGYDKVHRGLDFGAPEGTPIRAAGDGIITAMTYNDTYGNHILIGHPNEYSTLYAHMSAYGRGLKRGIRVKQGQIIGYVGATGLVTGPHLHYEVRVRGVQVNPSSLKFPPGKTLGGLDLYRYRLRREELEKVFAELGPKFTLATVGTVGT